MKASGVPGAACRRPFAFRLEDFQCFGKCLIRAACLNRSCIRNPNASEVGYAKRLVWILANFLPDLDPVVPSFFGGQLDCLDEFNNLADIDELVGDF